MDKVLSSREYIFYDEKSLKGWLKALDTMPTVEQAIIVDTSINRKWKNIFAPDIKDSLYQKYLGKSLLLEGKSVTGLYDISYSLLEDTYTLYFKGLKVKTKVELEQFFKEYEMKEPKKERKIINDEVKKKIIGCFNRF